MSFKFAQRKRPRDFGPARRCGFCCLAKPRRRRSASEEAHRPGRGPARYCGQLPKTAAQKVQDLLWDGTVHDTAHRRDFRL